MAEIVDAYLFGRLGELTEFESRVRAVTRDEMRAVARSYFVDDRRVEGVVRGVVRDA
jgi:predicted Zn-dependent peptidase